MGNRRRSFYSNGWLVWSFRTFARACANDFGELQLRVARHVQTILHGHSRYGAALIKSALAHTSEFALSRLHQFKRPFSWPHGDDI
jgi:hypothetical protein